MREFEIGMRVSPDTGVGFFGLEEVNVALQQGAKVTTIKPGEAMFRKSGEDDEKVRLVFSGFKFIVVLDE